VVRISNDRSTTPPGRRAAQAGRAPAADRRWRARQAEILRAAGAVFRAKGFEAAGMRDIAQAAGLSAANLYYYFESKDALLYTCQDLALDRLLDAVRAAKAGKGSVEARLRAVLEAHLRVLLDEVEGGAAHLAIDALPAPLRQKVVEKRDRYERALRALVAEGVRAGELAPCDPTLVTRAMLGAINWTARWFRPDGKTAVDAVRAGFTDYLLRGLRP
jgi:AcrR family transcriptional regulator